MCLGSEGAQPEGPQFVIWLQEFPFTFSVDNHLRNDSILAIPVMLSQESFLLGLWQGDAERIRGQGRILARVGQTGSGV